MRQFSYFIARLGGAFALPILKKSLFEEIEIPVPPIVIQKEFSERAKEIRSLELDQVVADQRLESLFQSLLHRAFEGKL
jgi:type I restriction enzyme S subunit